MDRRTVGYVLIFASPLLGALTSAVFVMLRAIDYRVASIASSGIGFPFMVWFIRDALVNYVVALPVMLLMRKAGVRHVWVYVLASIATGYLVGHRISDPAQYAWQPSEEDFAHGIYWGLLFGYLICSGVTGLLFGIGRNLCVTEASATGLSANA